MSETSNGGQSLVGLCHQRRSHRRVSISNPLFGEWQPARHPRVDDSFPTLCGSGRRFGKVLGLTLSLVLLQIISTGFTLLGFSPHLTEAIWGATMILAIAIGLVREQLTSGVWLHRKRHSESARSMGAITGETSIRERI